MTARADLGNGERLLESHAEHPAVVDLAALCSLAVRAEPYLLRRLRLRFLPRSDASLEADLAFSHLVLPVMGGALAFDARVLPALRAYLRAERAAWLAPARHLIERAHHHLSPAIRLEEEAIYLAVRQTSGWKRHVSRLLGRAAKAIVAEGRDDLARWAHRALQELPTAARATEGYWLLASAASRRTGLTLGLGSAPGEAIADISAVLSGIDFPKIDVGVSRDGEDLVLTVPPAGARFVFDAPDTRPVPIEIASHAGMRSIALARDEPDSVVTVEQIGIGPVTLQTLDGASYEIPAASERSSSLRDDHAAQELSCVVVMPLGKRRIADGSPYEARRRVRGAEDSGVIDFDAVYDVLIKRTMEDMGIRCVRSDALPSFAHRDAYRALYEADIAIFDITTPSADVYYQLGIRHALASHVTILIKQSGQAPPFNIHGFKVIDYPQDMSKLSKARATIRKFVRARLDSRETDSPVHHVLKLRISADTDTQRVLRHQIFSYALNEVAGKRIRLITGDLQEVRDIDVWVSMENTNMQMSRYFEPSVSAIVRYFGAKRDSNGNVVDDIVANELAALVGPNVHVVPGRVIQTSAGELSRTHGVKRIFHVATLVGQIGKGYALIADLGICVRNALEFVGQVTDDRMKSILIPVPESPSSWRELDQTATQLIGAAISYLGTHPQSGIEQVNFLVQTEPQLKTCRRILHGRTEVRALSVRRGARSG